MLFAETTCSSKSGATFRLAHFLAAVTVAVSFFIHGGCIAVVESAEPPGTMFPAEPTNFGRYIAPISRADPLPTIMRSATPSCYSKVTAAFSREVDGVLLAKPISFYSGGGATHFNTFAICSMFEA